MICSNFIKLIKTELIFIQMYGMYFVIILYTDFKVKLIDYK